MVATGIAQRSIPKYNPAISYRLAAKDDAAVASGDGDTYQPPLLGPDDYVEQVRLHGGLKGLERIIAYGRTDQNKKIKFRPWYKEVLRAACDHRIPHRIISGASQTGKSLAAQLGIVDVLIHGRIPTGYAYATDKALNKYVSTQFRPITRNWIAQIERLHQIVVRHKDDKNTNDPMTVGGVAANFSSAGTSRETASNEGGAIVSTSGASYPAGIMGQDEKTRWPPGVSFSARLGYSPFPSKPVIDVGTKGGGAGIEIEIDKADHLFTQHYTCEHCGVTAPLSPLGCLFVEQEVIDPYGRVKMDYFDNSGRPLDWWHEADSTDPKDAKICCSACGHEIPFEQRVNAHMRCTITGIGLTEYLDNLPHDWTCSDTVAIDLSPLCRENSSNIAITLVKDGLEASDPRIFQQEDLGIVSRTRNTRLTLQILKPLIGAPCPNEMTPWATVAGIDCGRGQHWLWINEVYVPINWTRMHWSKLQQTAIRKVVFGAKVRQTDIEDLLDHYGVDIGAIDNEPEITWAAGLCDRTVLQMANQQASQRHDVKPGTAQSGGEEHPCWQTSDKVFKQITVNNCTRPAWDMRPSYRFPPDWSAWIHKPTDDSPLRHLCGPYFDTRKEKWERPKDSIDDLFMAAYFAEVAMLLQFNDGSTFDHIEY